LKFLVQINYWPTVFAAST